MAAVGQIVLNHCSQISSTHIMPMDLSMQDNKEIESKIGDLKKEIILIDNKSIAAMQQLNSVWFKLLTLFGLGHDDLRIDPIKLDIVLLDLPNTNLSKGDLERKVALFAEQKKDLLVEINGLIAELRDLHLEATKESEEKHARQRNEQKEVFLSQYNHDPLGFMAAATSISLPEPERNQQKLFDAADQLLAVTSSINLSIDKSQIKKAWQVVCLARDISAKNIPDKNSSFYAKGAEQFFAAVAKCLPEDLREIEILYKAGQYSKVNEYLDRFLFSADPITNDQRQSLLSDIDKQKQVFNKQALNAMARK